MGRPLKIKHTTTVDIGYPSFASMDTPTQSIPTGMTDSEYMGIVGGGVGGSVATATYPVIAVNAYFPIAAAGEAAYIITQKGKTKYMVVSQTTQDPADIIVGNSYIINSLGDTDFQSLGAPTTAIAGDLFTATAAATAGTTGLVNEVVIAYLADVATGSLAAGEMNASFDAGAGAVLASRIENKYIWDYSTPAVRYATNFFAGSTAATIEKSGAQVDTWTNGTGLLDLAEVTDYTS